MLIDNRKYNFAIINIFCSIWFFCIIISLSGCSGNIQTASSLVSGRVTLSWNEIPDAISYNIYASTSPRVTKLTGFKIRTVSSPFTITQLSPGKTYYFVITVVTDSGESKESKEKSYTAIADTEGTIEFGDIVSHSKPDAVVSEQPTTSKDLSPKTHDVTLAWDDVPNATSYNIYWSDKPGVSKNNGTKISNVKNPHKIAGLKKGKKYYFVVTAVNASGESKESKELSFTVGR